MKINVKGIYVSIIMMVLIALLCPVNASAQDDAGDGSAAGENGQGVVSPFKGAGPDEKRKIDLTFDDMDIYPVLDDVLGNILELNFVVDPAIRGTISVRIQGKYSKNELLDLFNSMLQMHGLAIVHGDYGLYKVVKKSGSPKQGDTVLSESAKRANPGDVTRVFQLRYLSAQHTITNLKNFISAGAVILAVPSSNSVVITDTAENLRKVSRIISLLDTNLFKQVHWKLFSLENTDPEDMAKDLENIFKSKGIFARPGIDTDSLQIITLNSINAILVITRWPAVLKEIEVWIAELEQGQIEKGSNVYVYFVQNGKAKELSDLLNNLYAEGSSGSSGRKKILVKRTKKGESTVRTELSGELSGEVKIIADEANNALVIKARPKDYAIIKDVLDKLDIMPRQVLVEVIIAEVQLQDELAYGVEWFIKQKGINIAGNPYNADMALTAAKTLTEDTPLGEGYPGFSYGLFNNDGQLMALITLIDATTNFNLLSTPNILASDNQEASIEIGEDVPVLSESTISSGGVKTQGVQYRKTGIILHVKPTINDNGLVRMEITQEVSAVDDNAKTSGITSPRIRNRKATTFLTAHDGQHILIGGIMHTEASETSSGIPILKDIPYLGYLFGSTTTKENKKELIFIVTPHVIKSREHADELTREFAEKVHSLKNMLQSEDIITPEESIHQEVGPSGAY